MSTETGALPDSSFSPSCCWRAVKGWHAGDLGSRFAYGIVAASAEFNEELNLEIEHPIKAGAVEDWAADEIG